MTEPVNQMTDGALLAAFSATGNQAAFAEIVQRHGAMVHGVCLRGLGDHHEAEDAAQAVFVTLARKAASLRQDPSVGGWLHTVARRLAKDMRRSRAARQRREERAMSDSAVTGNEGMDPRLFRESLDDALGGLPERYRRPLVLFHLEGRSLQQTAVQLGLTASATGVRLSRARELLRQKLVRRGIGVGSVGALTALLSAESGAAVLPATFVASTVKAATGGAVSTTVAALTKGALKMLFIAKVKAVSLAAAACLVVAGTGIVTAKQLNAPSPVAPPASPSPIAATAVPPPPMAVAGLEKPVPPSVPAKPENRPQPLEVIVEADDVVLVGKVTVVRQFFPALQDILPGYWISELKLQADRVLQGKFDPARIYDYSSGRGNGAPQFDPAKPYLIVLRLLNPLNPAEDTRYVWTIREIAEQEVNLKVTPRKAPAVGLTQQQAVEIATRFLGMSDSKDAYVSNPPKRVEDGGTHWDVFFARRAAAVEPNEGLVRVNKQTRKPEWVPME